jgi:DnaJ family protein A protein 2
VTLEEIYNGATKKIAINRDRVCLTCNGEGGANAKTCTECKGRGMVRKLMQVGPGMYTQSTGPCDDCSGRGKVFDAKNRCKTCKGK